MDILAVHETDMVRSYLFEVRSPGDVSKAVSAAQHRLLQEARSMGYNTLWREGYVSTTVESSVNDSYHASPQMADDSFPESIATTHRGAVYGGARYALTTSVEDTTTSLHRRFESACDSALKNELRIHIRYYVYILFGFRRSAAF